MSALSLFLNINLRKINSLLSGGTAAAPPPVVETPWSEEAPEVLHLSDGDFKSTIADNSRVLVMFYAPWCGHCKRAKPDYATAAKSVNAGKIGKLAAIDCTLNQGRPSSMQILLITMPYLGHL